MRVVFFSDVKPPNERSGEINEEYFIALYDKEFVK